MRRDSILSSACLTLFILPGLYAADPQAVDWHTDFDEARAQSKELRLPLLLHFYGKNCPPCRVMEHEVFASPEFRAAIPGRFVIAKLEARRNLAIADRYGIQTVPADVILDPKGGVLYSRVGYQQGGSQIYLSSLSKYRGEAALPTNHQRVAEHPKPVVPQSTVDRPIGVSPRRLANPQKPETQYRETRLADSKEKLVPPPSEPMKLPIEERFDPPTVAVSNPPRREEAIREDKSAEAEPDEAPVESPKMQKAPANKIRWGLDGYSPVTLKNTGRWIAGADAFTASFRGQTFRFTEQSEVEEFEKEPELFVPQGAGLDLVEFEETGRNLAGSTKFGAFYNGRLYLFRSQETRTKFKKNPSRYAEVREGAWLLETGRLASAR